MLNELEALLNMKNSSRSVTPFTGDDSVTLECATIFRTLRSPVCAERPAVADPRLCGEVSMKTVPTWSKCRGCVSCYVGVASGHYVYIKCPPLPTTHSVVIFNTTDGPYVLPLVHQLIMSLIEVLVIYGFINLIN